MVLLLAEKGVPLTNFEKLQTGYYGLLDDMCDEAAEYFLRFRGEFSLLREIKAIGIDGQMKKRMKTLKNKELEAMKKAAGQTRILVPQSRVVFAVCDPYTTSSGTVSAILTPLRQTTKQKVSLELIGDF